MSVDRNCYTRGSTARKLDYVDYPRNEEYSVLNLGKKNNKKVYAKSKANRVPMILTFCATFIMLLVVTYRYNVINEKLTLSQELDEKIVALETDLSKARMQVEQSITLEEISNVAKQELGMQKRDESQIVYIDTLNETLTKAEVVDKTANPFFKELIDEIKKIINEIFSNN